MIGVDENIPDLTTFRPHKVIDDIDIDGVAVPGLRGAFYRRERPAGLESVGVYSFAEGEVFMAWGYVGEEHCRYTAVRRPDGSWAPPYSGCPKLRVLRSGSDGRTVTGVEVLTASPPLARSRRGG